MKPKDVVEARLHALGFAVVVDLERTYAGRIQLTQWAPSWTATIRQTAGSFPIHLRGYHTMSLCARVPLNQWVFLRDSGISGAYELLMESTPQKPPWWLDTWPKDPRP